mgnify:CR=1 FL=1
MEEYQVYQDIKARTNGEIYIGVVGPVRTGKSTFIKRFMNQMVIPNISGENDRQLAQDELPQSASGKTIMTTEPKFIPKEAVSINVADNLDMKVKMIDCVGYVVKDAEGQFEDGKERMVRTPWFDYDIPFSKAAEIGTNKVINNHSTVGIVVTTDGSFGELPRESYLEAEGHWEAICHSSQHRQTIQQSDGCALGRNERYIWCKCYSGKRGAAQRIGYYIYFYRTSYELPCHIYIF